jgi:CRP-like cAMP-binding protein
MKAINHLWGNIFKEKNEDYRDIRNLLKQIPLFGRLSRGELNEMLRLIHHRQYQGGEVIFWEGEPGVGMYIVQKGEVGIYQDYAKEDQKELAHLVPGDFFGEMALLEEDCRSATAVALNEAHLFALIHPDLFDMVGRKPQLGVKLLTALANMLARRLRQTNQDLQQLAKSSPAVAGKTPSS